MILTDKIWMGAAAGSVGMAAFGNKDADVGDRLASGAVLGVVAGLGAQTAYSMAKSSGRFSWRAGSKYLSSMGSHYGSLTKAGVKPLTAAFHAYGTRGVFTGLGAVIGASVAGEDHRMEGAGIGAAAGFAARNLVGGANLYKQWGHITGGKNAFIGGLSALAFVGASAFTNNDEVAVASYSAGNESGYEEFAPGSAPDSGIQERIKNIGAHGNVVLGAHGSRHG